MADGELIALQRALRAGLIADAAIAALVSSRVYDEPPERGDPDYATPFIRFGRFIRSPMDTDSTAALDIAFGLEVHTEPAAGRASARQVSDVLYSSLHRQEGIISASLAADGFHLVDLTFEADTDPARRAEDDQAYVATVAFRCLIEPA